MNIWQTVYEQLQEILLELNKLWYTYWGMFMSGNLVVNEWWIYYKETIMNTVAKISYHELFSKDSGIMKFVEWKPPLHKYIWTEADLDYYKQHWKLSFHYMIMWQMTSEQKIQYFLDNVIIPTK